MGLLEKQCTRCQETKPLNLDFFPPHKNVKSGFDSWCRKCRNAYRSNINRGKFKNVISSEDLISLKSSTKECTICGEEKPLVIDHDHATGQIRGMLCNNCNIGLGHFYDDPKLLEFAQQYLYASKDSPEWEEYLAK